MINPESESTPGRRIISVTLDNEFGSLTRVVSLFSGRGYNIESLSVNEVDRDKQLSRIIIQTICTKQDATLIIKLLNRIVPVHQAKDMTDDNHKILGQLVLCKSLIKPQESEHVTILDSYNGMYRVKIVTLYLDSPRLDQILLEIQAFDIVKTGLIAISSATNPE